MKRRIIWAGWGLLAAAALVWGCGPREEAVLPPPEAVVQPSPAEVPLVPAEPEAAAEEGTVTVYRDTWGVPHVFAKTMAEAAYGLGYAQAEDRLEDLYMNIRTATGTMAEAFGPDHVQRDYLIRLVRNAERCQAYWETAPDYLKALGDNFMAGVRTYLEEHPEESPEFATELEGWHCAAIARAMILQWPIGTVFDDLRNKDEAPPFGSNGWAVSPSRSAEGCAILVTDPHLTWEGMAVFYEARIHTEDHDSSGFFLVGCPLVALGHNAHVAWAYTTGGPDTSDVYMLKLNPQNPVQYEYDGAWRDAEVTTITIPVKGSEPVQRMAAYTHLGPVIGEPDLASHVAYVGASPYFEMTSLFEELYRLCTAGSCAEFCDALALHGLMEQNVIFADTKGNIQYVRSGATPIRPEGYNWSAPVPGNTSTTAWNGLHDIADLVQILNPEQGYLQNCNISPANMMVNSPMTPDKYRDYIYNVSWDKQNPRSRRLVQLLESDRSLTKEKAFAIATDVYDILAGPWQEALIAAVDADATGRMDDPAFAGGVNAILAWDGEYRADSTGAPLMKFWRLKCQQAGIDCGAIAQGQPLSGEDQTKFLEQLALTLAELKDRYDTLDLTWGTMHKVGRGQRLFPAPGADYGGGPVFTETLFDVKSKEEGGVFLAHSGSMATQVILLYEDGVESYTCTPWGQSARLESPHYVDQAERLYSTRTLKPSWFDKTELMQHVESQTVLRVP